MGPPPGKRNVDESEDSAATKKVKHQQRYRLEYSMQFPVLVKSKVSENHVFCKACKVDFSVSHGGLNDCTTHVNGPVH